jgi:hypothetical protein
MPDIVTPGEAGFLIEPRHAPVDREVLGTWKVRAGGVLALVTFIGQPLLVEKGAGVGPDPISWTA